LDENLNRNYKVFEPAPEEARQTPTGSRKTIPDYFL
jgi:hypothetical protein